MCRISNTGNKSVVVLKKRQTEKRCALRLVGFQTVIFSGMVGHDVLLNLPDTNAEQIDVINNQGKPSADRTSAMH
jgi:hypothetical protein